MNLSSSGFSNNLYSFDLALRFTSRIVHNWGISVDPPQAVVGTEGWLHLGDYYRATISDDRRHATEADLAEAARLKAAALAWGHKLRRRGVQAYLILVGPNKSSIYPETVPVWAQPSQNGPIDALLINPGPHYVDLRAALIGEKRDTPLPLYYPSDTHWNMLGAGTAFRSLSDRAKDMGLPIRWPSREVYAITGSPKRQGGDLARFLHLEADLSDADPQLSVNDWPTTVIQRDWTSGQILNTGPISQIQSPSSPLLVESSGALNDAKVLWLRDSFGVAMSPFMAATFSNVLQLRWDQAYSDNVLLELVRSFKPDYVFVTVVQRDARSAQFTALPPAHELP
ncbi:hypothetical protein [Rhizobium sp. CECT 9324]|uniref:alginate O-acetyltransferase AlgX-related protein n=1 Tax=Rhizobium sp. CECT 9324 TaxID=2845820 RepID=UPI0033A30B6C